MTEPETDTQNPKWEWIWSLFSLCLYLCLRCCVFVMLPFFSVNKDLYKIGHNHRRGSGKYGR